MGLAAGTKLGSYEVIAPLGVGGMGEVYEATDSRLKRRVAIKIISSRITADRDAVALFEREAQSLAAINHPNIATVYGLQETPAGYGIVMELVDGDDLSHKIGKKPLSIEESIAIARQICDGLEAAHERGIIHRDLKPGNIKITADGTVKIIDFGLAKPATSDSDPSNSPTILTIGGEGAVIGTAPYMSPEQAKGRQVDARTDVWAFGCVLFEMLTATRAFEGETATEILAAVIKTEPDWTKLPKNCPPHLVRLLHRCLAKDLKKRIRHIGDVRYELDDTTDQSSGVAHVPVRKLWTAATVSAVAVGVIAAGIFMSRPKETPRPTRRFEVSMPGFHDTVNSFASFSRSGKNIAWLSQGKFYVRDLSDLSVHSLTIGESPGSPILSNDGEFIAYSLSKKLWKVPIMGGAPIVLCDIPGTGEILTGDWGPDDDLYFAVWRGDVYRVGKNGGDPIPVIKLDHSKYVDIHRIHFINRTASSFTYFLHAFDGSQNESGIFEDGKLTPFSLRGESPVYSKGNLIYEVEQGNDVTLWSVPYSLKDKKTIGVPVLLANNAMLPMASDDGTIAYVSTAKPRGVLTWVSRKGQIQGNLGGELEWMYDPALSPDGSKIAFSGNDGLAPPSVWVFDIKSGSRSRLSFGDKHEGFEFPSWSPKGDKLLYTVLNNMDAEIQMKNANGSSGVTILTKGAYGTLSPDGKILMYSQLDSDSTSSIRAKWLDGSGKESVLYKGKVRMLQTSISPDGRYMAYTSDETGRSEIYVRHFPDGEGQWEITTEGGRSPQFSTTGKELFFRAGNALYSVPVTTGAEFGFQSPQKLFELDSIDLSQGYSATPDGQRFIAIQKLERDSRKIVVLENWKP